jgi:hypothetical protein
MYKQIFKNLYIKHEAQFLKVEVELNVKEVELKEMEQRRTLYEL